MAPEALAAWHDFFVLIGTGAATLIGAMFVVVSIGIGFLTRERKIATHTFLTSTVTHVSTALFGSILIMVPGLEAAWLGAVLGLAGLAGLCYSVRVVIGFRQHQGTDWSDWFWYALFPFGGYGLLLAAGAAVWRGGAVALDLLAAALAALLLVGIRNGWDMIVFLVTQPRDST